MARYRVVPNQSLKAATSEVGPMGETSSECTGFVIPISDFVLTSWKYSTNSNIEYIYEVFMSSTSHTYHYTCLPIISYASPCSPSPSPLNKCRGKTQHKLAPRISWNSAAQRSLECLQRIYLDMFRSFYADMETARRDHLPFIKKKHVHWMLFMQCWDSSHLRLVEISTSFCFITPRVGVQGAYA